jgi:hypothetical protein
VISGEIGLRNGGGDTGGRRRRGEMVGGLGQRGKGIPRSIAQVDERHRVLVFGSVRPSSLQNVDLGFASWQGRAAVFD